MILSKKKLKVTIFKNKFNDTVNQLETDKMELETRK